MASTAPALSEAQLDAFVLSHLKARGYSEEGVSLEPAWWALLRDPFGSSKILAKWL